MKKRPVLIVLALGVLILVAALGVKPRRGLLVLDWAGMASSSAPPKAILIEMGLKDIRSIDWSGRARVVGATVVHREGYRFHSTDKLLDPDGWQAASNRPPRIPPAKPALLAMEGYQSVGIVLHLNEIKDDASLTIQFAAGEHEPAKIPLKEVLDGKARTFRGGNGVVRLISTALPVAAGPTEDDYPAAAHGPDGTLWVAYNSYHVQEDNRRIEPPKLEKPPANFKNYDDPGWHDQVFVKGFKDGKWTAPIAITDARQDIVRCALAVEPTGRVWVFYSAQRDGQHRIFARSLFKGELDKEQPLPGQARHIRNLNPAACTDQEGQPWVCYQSWTENGAGLAACKLIKGKWEPHSIDPGTTANCWHPALSAGPGGEVALVHDGYRDGDYDVGVQWLNAKGKSAWPAATAAFEARPAAAFDPQGRLWIAHELGPDKWGKDYGALDDKDGNPLYFQRTVRVLCLQEGKVFEPKAELPPLAKRIDSPATGNLAEGMPRYAYPKIGIDSKGRVWLTYRVKFGSRHTTAPGPYWLTFARRLDGDRWTDPIEIHHSDGLLDDRPVLLPHAAGGLLVVHNTDGRYTTPETVDNQIYLSYLDLPGDPKEPVLVPRGSGGKNTDAAHKEAEAVRRIREYRVAAGGKTYHLLRGEFHRHTEISWDGGPDGSLEDMFRYGIDAAAMDWIGNGDHDNGAGREYSWWLTQKLTDAYHVPGRFIGMFSYERSVPYPHGHRNCIFDRRGIRTLPRLAEPDPKKRVAGIHADDTKMFYRYLKELGGICASHTSATSMGTDWRDHDPEVEPIVEIYQGDRMSYEMEEAPRAGFDPKSKKEPTNIAGWFPKGYINLALQMGHRLGFQSSSDHFSTHISYCIVLAELPDRSALLDALKQRHCYGATDDIVLDVRCAGHIMGDALKTDKAPTLEIRVLGTAPLARVEVVKDSKVVHAFTPGKAEFTGRWTDPTPGKGEHYYYLRVVQEDGELAWGSPMWVTMEKERE